MISMKMAKAGFFDQARIKNSMNAATRQALSKFGALVRKRSQKSLQVNVGPSVPGRPPHIHQSLGITKVSKSTGRVRHQKVSPLRAFLFFSYDAARQSVVIGPAKLNKLANLRALEEGGASTLLDQKTRQRRAIDVIARPFMKPAFESELPAARLWQNAMK